jgi:hypothetical protein
MAINEETPDILCFEREAHEYSISGKRVQSVTQILRNAGLVRFFCSRAVLDEARRRGKIVHDICADADKGNLHYAVEDRFNGYLRAWVKFTEEWQFKPDLVEERVSSPVHRFAGTFDVAGWIFADVAIMRRYVIIDRKTGGYSAWHREQLAGYQICIRERQQPALRLGVYLRPNGEYRAKNFSNLPLDDLRDQQNFIAAMTVAQLREARGLVHNDIGFDEIFTGEYDRAAFPGVP